MNFTKIALAGCFCLVSFSALADSTSTNVANNRLLALPQNQQANMLGKVVGDGCIGKKAFFMGLGKEPAIQDYAFWSVRCSNKQSYMVEIQPDSVGSSKVLECSMIKFLHAGQCFKKF